MPDMQDVINLLAEFLKPATFITVIMGVSKAGLSIIYHAITGKD